MGFNCGIDRASGIPIFYLVEKEGKENKNPSTSYRNSLNTVYGGTMLLIHHRIFRPKNVIVAERWEKIVTAGAESACFENKFFHRAGLPPT